MVTSFDRTPSVDFDGGEAIPAAPSEVEPAPAPAEEVPELPAGAVAARLLEAVHNVRAKGLVHVVSDETRAEEIGRALISYGPDFDVLVLPPWDCLPYDRASPSREVMGRRMAVLRELFRERDRSFVLIAPLEALLQRVPPASVVRDAVFTIEVGKKLDLEALQAFAAGTGYVLDDRVDEPGEIAFLGGVVDIFPAASPAPCRLRLSPDGTVVEIHDYDAASQLTIASISRLAVGPASEVVATGSEVAPDRSGGCEHKLGQFYPSLDVPLSAIPDAALSIDAAAEARLKDVQQQIEEARRSWIDLGGNGTSAGAANSLYLTAADWRREVDRRKPQRLSLKGIEPVRTTGGQSGTKAMAAIVEEAIGKGLRVVIVAPGSRSQRIGQRLERLLGKQPEPAEDWTEVLARENGALLSAPFQVAQSFLDANAGVAVVSSEEFFGAAPDESQAAALRTLLGDADLRIGDTVVHEDHGLGILRATERIALDGVERDTLRLEYRDGASLLVPVEEFGRIWRYGSGDDAVTLDRLDAAAWLKKREKLDREIDAAAARLIADARSRAEANAPVLVPPKTAYARVAARFPYPLTRDQDRAIRDVLADLSSGKPMNRLICGDVGFGKTEVCIRAAAAAALSGKQVAVVAPTTVLVRQHCETFERRFAGTGIKVAALSRLTAAKQAKSVKAGLKSGDLGIVVATQAIASKTVEFANLGLLAIDEEHRFGTKLKAALRAMAPDLHVLTMSATPIPRTLQSAMVGVQEVSVIATPPALRRPIRTLLAPFEPAAIRTALLRAKRRGGQSFFVVPRVEDIEKVAGHLATLVPELSFGVAHGDLDPKPMDEAMIAFARGETDVLLATNIIENGLDVPQANTMIVWRADRFGLSQLHQLRGRVGRGRAQGLAYLLTPPGEEIAAATRTRLSTLVALDRLGSGLAISARDLDLRGAGDLFGEEQAGHIKLIGAGLYQDLLARAVEAAKGGNTGAMDRPRLNLGKGGSVPVEYVPEPTVRFHLYSRLLRIANLGELEAFASELEDRFGEYPAEVTLLLETTAIALRAGPLGISAIDAGPDAIAVRFCDDPDWEALASRERLSQRGDRLLFARATEAGEQRIAATRELLGLIETAARSTAPDTSRL